jgi:hypothetical protein
MKLTEAGRTLFLNAALAGMAEYARQVTGREVTINTERNEIVVHMKAGDVIPAGALYNSLSIAFSGDGDTYTISNVWEV